MQNSPPKKEKMTNFQAGLQTPPGTSLGPPRDTPGTYPEPSGPPRLPLETPKDPETMTGYMYM